MLRSFSTYRFNFMSSLVKGCRIRSLCPHFNITLTTIVLVTYYIKEFKIGFSLQSPNPVCPYLSRQHSKLVWNNGIWNHEKWESERILGRWPEYVNFTKVIFRGCIQTESNGISWTPAYFN